MATQEPQKKRRPRDQGGQLKAKPGWEERFFVALRESYLPGDAARKAGVSRAHVYRCKKADPSFAERWEDAVEHQTEVLEQIAVKRAAEGSDNLMIFLLKSRRPEVYRENVHHEHDHHHEVEGTVTLLDGRQPVQIEAAKRREAARLLLAGEPQDGEEVIEGTVVDDAA